MQKISFLLLALITGFCLEPLPVIAQDQSPNKEDAKDAKGLRHADKGGSHRSTDISKGTEQGEVSRGEVPNGKSSDGAFQARKHTMPDSGTYSQGNPQSDQRQSSRLQAPGFAVEGNVANHYNGRWSPAGDHLGWDQQTNHRWNNHDYRWYDGGWLIIDPGYPPGYNFSGSVGSDVQASLTRQGYYHGPIDGYVGRGTRRAIAHYESDNGLEVNGRIDGPLLVSLRLE